MRHKMLTQHAHFALTPIQKGHVKSANYDACHTSSAQHLLRWCCEGRGQLLEGCGQLHNLCCEGAEAVASRKKCLISDQLTPVVESVGVAVGAERAVLVFSSGTSLLLGAFAGSDL